MFFRTRDVVKIILFTVFVWTARTPAYGQIPIDISVGVRGGVFNGGTPIEVSSNRRFPPSYSGETFPYTFGPTIGVLAGDALEIRFEAVRSRFRFRGRSGTPFPASSIRWTSTTDGHIWQYPLLATYHSRGEGLRAFIGGGISLSQSISGTTHTETITVAPLPDAVTNTTEPFQRRALPRAIYVTGGITGRASFLSIRPEFRYARWTNTMADQENAIVFSPNQIEFLIGISIHPLALAGR